MYPAVWLIASVKAAGRMGVEEPAADAHRDITAPATVSA